jgi:hypothetical protein
MIPSCSPHRKMGCDNDEVTDSPGDGAKTVVACCTSANELPSTAMLLFGRG